MAARRLRGALQLGARQRLRAAAAPPGSRGGTAGASPDPPRGPRAGPEGAPRSCFPRRRPSPAQARGAVRPAAQPARPGGRRRRVGAPRPAQPLLPQPRQQAQGVLGAAHHRVLHAGDVRRGGQRGGLQELRALVQEVGGGLQADGPPPGAAGGGLPARAGALHLRRHPGPPPPRQGRLHRRAPLQPPGDHLALQPRHPRLPPHQHRGFLDLLRVPLAAALPAGRRLLRRGGQADGGRLRAARGQDLRARDAHPAGADVPRGAPDVRAARPPRTEPAPGRRRRPPSPIFIGAHLCPRLAPPPGAAAGDHAPARAGAAGSPPAQRRTPWFWF